MKNIKNNNNKDMMKMFNNTPEQIEINLRAIDAVIENESTPVIEACYDLDNCFKVLRKTRLTRRKENPSLKNRMFGSSEIEFGDEYMVFTMDGYQLGEDEITRDLEEDAINNGSMVWLDVSGTGESFIIDVHYMELEEQDEDGYNIGGDLICCDI